MPTDKEFLEDLSRTYWLAEVALKEQWDLQFMVKTLADRCRMLESELARGRR